MVRDSAVFDPVLLAVMANRVDAAVREMTSTVVLTACSSVIGMARDFSCSVLTADHQILSAAEGIPAHVFGGNLQGAKLVEMHPDLKEGDAFLNNDPYSGNSHPADHTFLVPVFHEGVHIFTTAVKCHQADCGNSLPTTYHAGARDIYEEGALIFPMVQVQRDYRNDPNIIAMCRRRIRVPDQWYGDFLSGLSAARAGERALKQLIAKFGVETVLQFKEAWLNYSERRARSAIEALPAARVQHSGRLDPMGDFLPDGLNVNVEVVVDPHEGYVTVDLRNNVDCLDNGLNLTEATATAMAITGVFNCLDHDIPLNSGAFRRIKVLLRENCAVGLPRFPHSCSVATTTLADIVCNIVQHSLSRLGRGQGMAEGNLSQPVSAAVISGRDHRKANADYINQIFLVGGGGPAGPDGDGLNYYIVPAGAGVAYRDSVESDELRFPILVRSVGLVTGSAGAGEYRGGLATRVEFSPRGNAMTVMTATNGASTVPRGARGGHDAKPAYNARSRNGQLAEVYQGYISVELAPGDVVVGIDSGGGGYGDPMDRDPLLVLEDVRESFETIERAHDIYGVYFVTDEDGMPVDIDWRATRARRATARASTA